MSYQPSTHESSQTSESSQESFISLSQHLENSPVTPISPTETSFPETVSETDEIEFNKLCQGLTSPIQIIPKKDIVWARNDPLHFFQSLAFVLWSESLTCVTQLYVASNQTITESQQKEITEIINLFLDLRPLKEIVEIVLCRQFSYIIKQFKKCFTVVDDFIKDCPGELSNLIDELIYKKRLTFDDIRPLLKLIWGKRRELRSIKEEKMGKATQRVAYHLCKMVRILEEIEYVWKKVKSHQADKSLVSLSKPFQFIENKYHCHAEIILLKAAVDHCTSKTLYIGVSKRPCYCCSLLFKAVTESQNLKFDVLIASTHGKLYANWNKIEGFLDKEFSQVWAVVVQKRIIEKILIEKPKVPMYTDDNSSVSGSTSGEEYPLFD
jgi:hypothetical protein